MSNPIIGQIMQANPIAQVLRQLFGIMGQSQDTMGILNQMSVNDPRMAQVSAAIQQHGGDPMATLNSLAQQRGVTPQYAMDQVRNMLGM